MFPSLRTIVAGATLATSLAASMPLVHAAPLAPTRVLPRQSVQSGTIRANRALAIRLELTTAAGKVTGTYRYGSNGKPLYLDGTQRGAILHLNERLTKNGKITAAFDGTVSANGAIEGFWTDLKTKRRWPFVIEEVGNDLKIGNVRAAGWYVIDAKHPDTHSLEILPLDANRLRLDGYAEWIGDEENGLIDTADAAGIATRQADGSFLYTDGDPETGCRLTLRFVGTAVAAEDNGACGGLNASFEGTYKKITSVLPER